VYEDTVFCLRKLPVATEFIGYMGKVNNTWVITTYISPEGTMKMALGSVQGDLQGNT
jgi:hypothetical protein